MAFDLFSIIMAVLSVLSFGAIGAVDVTETPVVVTTPVEVETQNPVIPTTPDKVPELPQQTETPTQTPIPTQTLPPTPTPPSTPTETQTPKPVETPKVQEGSDKIAGTWKGSKSIPFVATVNVNAIINEDGTATISGTAQSNVVGNHVFNSPATWTYLGGNSFDTIVEGVHTAVTCDGSKLTFPANPYRLGLINNPIADQEFIIDMYRV